MSKANVKKFYELVKKDNGLKESLKKVDKEIGEVKEIQLPKLVEKEIVPLAKSKGLSFTTEEFIDYLEKKKESLTMEELLEVSGGLSPKKAALGLSGALLLSFGSGAAMQLMDSGKQEMPGTNRSSITLENERKRDEKTSKEVKETPEEGEKPAKKMEIKKVPALLTKQDVKQKEDARDGKEETTGAAEQKTSKPKSVVRTSKETPLGEADVLRVRHRDRDEDIPLKGMPKVTSDATGSGENTTLEVNAVDAEKAQIDGARVEDQPLAGSVDDQSQIRTAGREDQERLGAQIGGASKTDDSLAEVEDLRRPVAVALAGVDEQVDVTGTAESSGVNSGENTTPVVVTRGEGKPLGDTGIDYRQPLSQHEPGTDEWAKDALSQFKGNGQGNREVDSTGVAEEVDVPVIGMKVDVFDYSALEDSLKEIKELEVRITENNTVEGFKIEDLKTQLESKKLGFNEIAKEVAEQELSVRLGNDYSLDDLSRLLGEFQSIPEGDTDEIKAFYEARIKAAKQIMRRLTIDLAKKGFAECKKSAQCDEKIKKEKEFILNGGLFTHFSKNEKGALVAELTDVGNARIFEIKREVSGHKDVKIFLSADKKYLKLEDNRQGEERKEPIKLNSVKISERLKALGLNFDNLDYIYCPKNAVFELDDAMKKAGWSDVVKKGWFGRHYIERSKAGTDALAESMAQKYHINGCSFEIDDDGKVTCTINTQKKLTLDNDVVVDLMRGELFKKDKGAFKTVAAVAADSTKEDLLNYAYDNLKIVIKGGVSASEIEDTSSIPVTAFDKNDEVTYKSVEIDGAGWLIYKDGETSCTGLTEDSTITFNNFVDLYVDEDIVYRLKEFSVDRFSPNLDPKLKALFSDVQKGDNRLFVRRAAADTLGNLRIKERIYNQQTGDLFLSYDNTDIDSDSVIGENFEALKEKDPQLWREIIRLAISACTEKEVAGDDKRIEAVPNDGIHMLPSGYKARLDTNLEANKNIIDACELSLNGKKLRINIQPNGTTCANVSYKDGNIHYTTAPTDKSKAEDMVIEKDTLIKLVLGKALMSGNSKTAEEAYDALFDGDWAEKESFDIEIVKVEKGWFFNSTITLVEANQ